MISTGDERDCKKQTEIFVPLVFVHESVAKGMCGKRRFATEPKEGKTR